MTASVLSALWKSIFDRQAFERTFHRTKAGRSFIRFMHGCLDSQRPPFVTSANRKNAFLNMLEHGFLDEMHTLRRDYPQLHADMPSMRCVGYRQAWDYLEGETDYDTFVEKGIVATRQLAKRQLTWLRKIPLAHTLDPYADSDYVQTALALARQHFQE